MKKLYALRHGLTVMNMQSLVAGVTETPLTDAGRAQAKQAALDIKQNGIVIDYIAVSQLERAQETARLIAAELGTPKDKIYTSELLAERDFGELEGTPWSPDLQIDNIPGLETDEMLVKRAQQAYTWLQSISADDAVVLVVSHGALIRALRGVVLNELPLSYDFRAKNAELIELA
jgi:broad specificity phosphatase PhoE